MSKGNTFENELLAHIFTNAAITNIGDAGGLLPSATAGSLYYALHTADPGEGGDQTTNECTYTGYARQGKARNGTNFSISGNTVNPGAEVEFAVATAGSETATHFSIGVAASGASKILYSGIVTPNIVITTGVIPRLTTATAITED